MTFNYSNICGLSFRPEHFFQFRLELKKLVPVHPNLASHLSQLSKSQGGRFDSYQGTFFETAPG
jgi:hypothetical protein